MGIGINNTWNNIKNNSYKGLTTASLFLLLNLVGCSYGEGNKLDNVSDSNKIETTNKVMADELQDIALGQFNDKNNDALGNYLKALEIYKKLDDKKNMYYCSLDMAKIYFNNGDFNTALKRSKEAYEYVLETYYEAGKFIALRYIIRSNIRLSDISNSNLEDMGYYIYDGQNIWKDMKLRGDISTKEKEMYIQFLQRVVSYYTNLNNLEVANETMTKVIYYSQEGVSNKLKIKNYIILGDLKIYEGDYEAAKEAFTIGYQLLDDDKESLESILHGLSESYRLLGDYETSLKYAKTYFDLERKNIKKQNIDAVAEMAVKYETEKKEKEIETGKKTQKLILGLSALLTLVLAREFRSRKKTKRKNEELAIKNIEIEKQKEEEENLRLIAEKMIDTAMEATTMAENKEKIANDAKAEVEKKSKELESKNEELKRKNEELAIKNIEIEKQRKHIEADVTNAKRLQDDIIPKKENLNKLFPENFTLLKPRDIVSGDMYFISKIEDKNLFGQIDYTGHGVPGAFLSIKGDGLIKNAIYRGHKTPASILNHVDKYWARYTAVDGHTDSMVIFLCMYDPKTGDFTYAGNEREMFIILDNSKDTLTGDNIRKHDATGNGYRIGGQKKINMGSDIMKNKTSFIKKEWNVEGFINNKNENKTNKFLLKSSNNGKIIKIEEEKLNQLYNNTISYKNKKGELVQGEIVFKTQNGETAKPGRIMIKGVNGNIFGMPQHKLYNKNELHINFFAVGSRISYVDNQGKKINGIIGSSKGKNININIGNKDILSVNKKELHNNQTLKIENDDNKNFIEYGSIVGRDEGLLVISKFKDTTVNIKKGTVYLYSDGYPDQYGGKSDKKFLSKTLRNLILKIQDQTMEEQKKTLDTTIENRMKGSDLGQTDDISIYGLGLELEKTRKK